MRAKHAVVVLMCWALSGCLGSDRVVRVVDGHEVEGRYVAAEAYDAFLRGTIAEADGDERVAAAWYARAFEYDPAAVEPLARLGYVLCKQRPKEHERADAVFARAIDNGPELGVTFVYRAKCELVRGDAAAAERDAREALLRDAFDGEATLTLAEALERAGRAEAAAQALDGWVLWTRGSRAAWAAVADLAARRGDVVRQRRARAHLADAAGAGAGASGGPGEALAAIDRAIVRGELKVAQDAAVDARMATSTVAVRACALGRWSQAAEQARVVLDADPGDADALAVLAAVPNAADADARVIRLSWTLEHAAPLSPLAALVVADALRRRAGEEPARLFLARYGEIDAAGDPLVGALQRRLGR